MMNPRSKGHGYERRIRQELSGILCRDILTSRNVNRLLDGQGVDLVGTEPFNVQCKAQERGLSYHNVLLSMPEDHNYNIIFHKKNRAGEVVVMSKKDFYELLQMLKTNKII